MRGPTQYGAQSWKLVAEKLLAQVADQQRQIGGLTERVANSRRELDEVTPQAHACATYRARCEAARLLLIANGHALSRLCPASRALLQAVTCGEHVACVAEQLAQVLADVEPLLHAAVTPPVEEDAA